MKRIKGLCCAAVMMLCGTLGMFPAFEPVTAEAEEVDYQEVTDDSKLIRYRVYDDHAEVLGIYNTNYNGELTILSEIEGKAVTQIGESAFRCCSQLSSVIIPDSVKRIGRFAFTDCTQLANITIPGSVTEIGGNAFSCCRNLTNITIPDSVTCIEGGAFSYCTKLTSITIPDSVTCIEGGAFSYCTKLTSITIPDSVISIEEGAFSYCTNLTSIHIPESLTSISDGTFARCANLTEITIPDEVTCIGEGAFKDCLGLTEVKLSDYITIINDEAFEGCCNLSTINIPEQCQKIGEYAFCGCHCLSEITIPKNCSEIGKLAFASDYPSKSEISQDADGYIVLSYPDSATFLKKITILNPNILIYDHAGTISAGSFFKTYVKLFSTWAVLERDALFCYNGTICGYTGSSAQSYADMYGYRFESLGDSPEPIYILGDLTGDGAVSIDDAQLALKAYTEKLSGKDTNLTDTQLKAADINFDSELTVEDVQYILIYYTENTVAQKQLPWADILSR